MYKYKLSIIISCHNCRGTIGRLLDSIVDNDLEKDEYEVIISDDCSTDNFMEIVKTYDDKMNINYYRTSPNSVHCPGNTRQLGLDNAQGEWIVFSDHDDYFEPNCFKKVFHTINKDNIDTLLCTNFYRVNTDGEKVEYSGYSTIFWTHGKFYNHNMIKDNKIRYKKDMTAYEDVYFDFYVEETLHKIGNKQMFFCTDLFTYNWVQDLNSLSHMKKGDMYYYDFNFSDYISAICDSIFELSNDRFYDYKFNKILINFLMLYFAYQQGIYRLGKEEYDKVNKQCMHDFLMKICTEFEVDKETIIEKLYGDAEYYNSCREGQLTNLEIPYIETQSLRDFIMTI